MINNRLAAIFIPLLFSSCLVHKRGMYLSPLDSQTVPYHTIPFKSDSLKSAIYGSIVYSTGTANDQGQDWIHAGQAYIYRSHNLGNVQAYYGGNFTLGYILNRFGVTDTIRNMD